MSIKLLSTSLSNTMHMLMQSGYILTGCDDVHRHHQVRQHHRPRVTYFLF